MLNKDEYILGAHNIERILLKGFYQAENLLNQSSEESFLRPIKDLIIEFLVF